MTSCKGHQLSFQTGKNWSGVELDKAHALRCYQKQQLSLWQSGKANIIAYIRLQYWLELAIDLQTNLRNFLERSNEKDSHCGPWSIPTYSWCQKDYERNHKIMKTDVAIILSWLWGLAHAESKSWGIFIKCLNFVFLNSHTDPLAKDGYLTGSRYLRMTSDLSLSEK